MFKYSNSFDANPEYLIKALTVSKDGSGDFYVTGGSSINGGGSTRGIVVKMNAVGDIDSTFKSIDLGFVPLALEIRTDKTIVVGGEGIDSGLADTSYPYGERTRIGLSILNSTGDCVSCSGDQLPVSAKSSLNMDVSSIFTLQSGELLIGETFSNY